jgi:queuine/archaeosine tRNA-ribosyltransferase
MLVSKAVVDGVGTVSGKYSIAQRQRLLRVGVREFFRLADTSLLTMGDCGAFTYVRESVPPYTPAEVINFYLQCGFDFGLSVDHVILGFQSGRDRDPGEVPDEWKSRQELTIDLAGAFLKLCKSENVPFTPVGVAQGWSAVSYARSVQSLQKQGFRHIAFGGMVPLKTPEILDCLSAADKVRRSGTEFHLLGISRCEHIEAFGRFGVTSFDSTAPLRRAFKDDKHNY